MFCATKYLEVVSSKRQGHEFLYISPSWTIFGELTFEVYKNYVFSVCVTIYKTSLVTLEKKGFIAAAVKENIMLYILN